jgi:uncharacterized protein (TIRG00374 family)
MASFVLYTVTAGMLLGLVTLYASAHFRLLRRLAQSQYLRKPAAMLVELADDFRRRPRELTRVGIISFVFHVNKMCVLWLLLFSVGEVSNVFEVAVAVTIVEVAGLLPVSLAGLGVIEGSFMFVMGHFGTTHETALAAMLLSRVLLIPMSLIGAYLYFVGERATKSAEGVELPLAIGEQLRS